MKKVVLSTIYALLMGLLCSTTAIAYEGYEDMDEGRGGGSPAANRFYLGFSIGEGAYFSYNCGNDNCDSDNFIAAPFEFEVLLGFKLNRFFALDLAVDWAVDYYTGYYNQVTYLAGVKPGVRVIFPLLFHRFLYLRAALPLQYSLKAEKLLLGFLFGIGAEWMFGNLGLFAELDLAPYLVEVYPGYHVVPAQGRLGISLHF